jgi:hypothetical protein
MSVDFTQAAARRESVIDAVRQNAKRGEPDAARNTRSETLSGLAQNCHEQVAGLA